MFAEMDVDDSGRLDVKEVQEAATRLGLRVDKAELVKVFMACGVDNSGRVELPEFTNLVSYREASKHKNHDKIDLVQRIWKLFVAVNIIRSDRRWALCQYVTECS
eukprot:COSAG05_NODE_830_length_7099_cov_10.124000_3_plen_105_part_00